MNFLNLFKGYGKVNPNHLESQSLQKPSPKRRRIVAISVVLSLTLVLALTIAALLHETKESPPLGSDSTDSAIRLVCNVTRNPDSCFDAVSAANTSPNPDPDSILRLAVEISLGEVKNLSSSLKSIGSSSGDLSLRDCRDLIDDAVSRLADSAAELDHMTDRKRKDVMTWLSAALTDHTTCVDGLEEMGSTFLEEVKGKMDKSREYTSNALAILANFQAILDRFGMPRH